eukprot:8533862-Alexandrium_andersonii.AAC.1
MPLEAPAILKQPRCPHESASAWRAPTGVQQALQAFATVCSGLHLFCNGLQRGLSGGGYRPADTPRPREKRFRRAGRAPE